MTPKDFDKLITVQKEEIERIRFLEVIYGTTV
jgi:hypothetical protein